MLFTTGISIIICIAITKLLYEIEHHFSWQILPFPLTKTKANECANKNKDQHQDKCKEQDKVEHCRGRWTKLIKYNKVFKIIKQVMEIGNIDKIYRVVQYCCMYFVGDTKIHQTVGCCLHYYQLIDVRHLMMLSEAQLLRKSARSIRKVIKFVRGPKFLLSLLQKSYPFPSSPNPGLRFLECLTLLEACLRSVGQIFLIIFYLTDHHQTFYQLGLLSSSGAVADDIGNWGLWFRMFFSIGVVGAIGVNKIKRAIRTYWGINDHKGKRETIWDILNSHLVDLVSHTAQIFLFYGFVHRDFLSKTNLSVLGIISSTVRASRIFS